MLAIVDAHRRPCRGAEARIPDRSPPKPQPVAGGAPAAGAGPLRSGPGP